MRKKVLWIVVAMAGGGPAGAQPAPPGPAFPAADPEPPAVVPAGGRVGVGSVDLNEDGPPAPAVGPGFPAGPAVEAVPAARSETFWFATSFEVARLKRARRTCRS